jgi:hypothetical protein
MLEAQTLTTSRRSTLGKTTFQDICFVQNKTKTLNIKGNLKFGAS